MERLVIDNGLKTFEIADNNGNVRGTISFNPKDFGLPERLQKMEADIEEYFKGIEEVNDIDVLNTYDKYIRGKIDAAFGSPVSDVIFGDINCMTITDGVPLYTKALTVIAPIIINSITSEVNKSIDRMNKYTEGVIEE